MLFEIDPRSPTPVYRQIIDQVRYAVASGRLREGDRLDPIRDVAVQARVNRNTVARAYAELEREGFIRTRAGQGSFVCLDRPFVSRRRARQILTESFDALLVQARELQFTEPELRELLTSLFAERLKRIPFPKD